MTSLGTQVFKLCVLLHFFLLAVRSRNLTVFQEPSQIRALKGDNIQINCSYSDTVEQFRITWKRNSSTQSFCHRVENTFNCSSIIHCTERANITMNASTKSSSLIIYNLHLNDSDIYFCQVDFEIPPPSKSATGKGTRIIVQARPTVQLIERAQPYPNQGRELICTSQEFYPDDIQVSWFKDGQLITNGIKNGTLHTNSDGSFSTTSFLNLSVFERNESGTYSCQVNHRTLSVSTTEKISVCNQGSASNRRLWISLIASGLIVLIACVVVAVLCTRSISKKNASSSKKADMPESEPHAREQPPKDDNAVYSLLGQYPCAL